LTLSDDQTATISLPPAFGPFRYYGTPYTQLSICSNGFVMPGSATYTAYTNAALPYPSIPAPMLAACWDDLYPPVGGGVWYFHDTANHAFVVEYDSVAYYSPQTQLDKFEFVLYDTTARSYTGDNEFAYQYMTANNYISNTVGEQDPTYQIAIQGLFDGAYHRACAPIVAGRAIKFTTDTMAVAISERIAAPAVLRLALSAGNNPFRGSGLIRFSLPSATTARLLVFDINGRLVRTLLNSGTGLIKPGIYTMNWNGRDDAGRQTANGIYFYRLETPLGTLARKTVKVD